MIKKGQSTVPLPSIKKEKMAGRTLGAYKLRRYINAGTYGTVWEAQNERGDPIAIKETRAPAKGGAADAGAGGAGGDDVMPLSFQRERDALKDLAGHENVVTLLDTLTTARGTALVLEYVDSDLQLLLRTFRQRGVKPTRRDVVCIMHQLLDAVAYMHALGWAHRDIKCSNILISAKNVVKLADFGMARKCGGAAAAEADVHMTAVVVTLWYRAPELLAPPPPGAPARGGRLLYDARAVDMWSVGCILAEMMIGEPLFAGQGEVQQLRLIHTVSKAALHARILHKENTEGARAVADLVCKLLEHEPSRRLSAAQALEHAFFKLDAYPVEPHELEVRAFVPPLPAPPATTGKPPTTRPPPPAAVAMCV